jgi:hypothetical protein
MKSITKILFVAALAYAITAVSSFAQVVTFDENGHSSFGGAALPFAVGPDPSGGIAANVLIYTLPFVVTPGDIGLIENTNSTSLNLSDVVRFFTPAGANNSEIIFYSDVEATEPPPLDLADTGLPQTSSTTIFIPEIGPDNNNGATWTPVAGEAGSAPTGLSIQYNIISDVPEPGTLTLVACGGGLLLAALRRRQNKI